METIKDIQESTKKLVKFYIEKFEKEEKENPKDASLSLLFNTFKHNNVFEEIYLKVSLVNSLYGTQIYALNKIAQRILELNIDERIRAGDVTIVNDIASGHGIASKRSENEKEITFYSFATKYCSWSNQSQYPIFDSFVEKVLINYKNQKLLDFKSADLRNYTKFKNIIDVFKETFGLKEFSYKDLDKFLWEFGRQKFSTENNKK